MGSDNVSLLALEWEPAASPQGAETQTTSDRSLADCNAAQRYAVAPKP